MADVGSSVTLIFYRLKSEWWQEAGLNLIAAMAQFSSYTHVEIALGTESGQAGAMKNVARVFNDNVGVEVTQRTGRSPCKLQTATCSTPCPRAVPSRHALAQVHAARAQPTRTCHLVAVGRLNKRCSILRWRSAGNPSAALLWRALYFFREKRTATIGALRLS